MNNKDLFLEQLAQAFKAMSERRGQIECRKYWSPELLAI